MAEGLVDGEKVPHRAVERVVVEEEGVLARALPRQASSPPRRCGYSVVFGYLVDPASSHMLVSKIKPCMSKYKWYTMKLRMAH